MFERFPRSVQLAVTTADERPILGAGVWPMETFPTRLLG